MRENHGACGCFATESKIASRISDRAPSLHWDQHKISKMKERNENGKKKGKGVGARYRPYIVKKKIKAAITACTVASP